MLPCILDRQTDGIAWGWYRMGWDQDRSGTGPGQIWEWDRSDTGLGQIWDGTGTDLTQDQDISETGWNGMGHDGTEWDGR